MPYVFERKASSPVSAKAFRNLLCKIAFLIAVIILSACQSTQTSENASNEEDAQTAQTQDNAEAADTKAAIQEDFDDLYGALAFSKTNRNWSAVRNIDAAQTARSKVLAECGVSCEIELVFGPGKCGTFAFGRVGWAVGVGLGRDAAEASKTADKDCRQQGGQVCQAIPPICNTFSEEDNEDEVASAK